VLPLHSLLVYSRWWPAGALNLIPIEPAVVVLSELCVCVSCAVYSVTVELLLKLSQALLPAQHVCTCWLPANWEGAVHISSAFRFRTVCRCQLDLPGSSTGNYSSGVFLSTQTCKFPCRQAQQAFVGSPPAWTVLKLKAAVSS